MPFNPGDTVFFRHPEYSWCQGLVVDVDAKAAGGPLYTCKTNDTARAAKVPKDSVVAKLKEEIDVVPLQPDCLEEVPHDLLNLTVLHDSTLLRCLILRYNNDIIYTNIGAIVVALNPFNFNIDRYKDDKMGEY